MPGSDPAFRLCEAQLQACLQPLSAPPLMPLREIEKKTLQEETRFYKPAAVLVGLRDTPVPRLILTVRNHGLPLHAGQVAFPGGRMEAQDKDALHAALRESQEEIGLDPTMVTPWGYLECVKTSSGYCVTPLVARIAMHAQLEPEPKEVSEVFEIPLDFFLAPAQKHDVLRAEHGHLRTLEFNYLSYRIWGVTAAIIGGCLRGVWRLQTAGDALAALLPDTGAPHICSSLTIP